MSTNSFSRRGSLHRHSRSQERTDLLTDQRALVYIRASTDDQKLTLDGQEFEARRFARANNLEISHVLIEPGVSGSKPFLDRKQGKLALQTMKREGIHTLLVMSIDRAFRSVSDMHATIEHLLDQGFQFRMVSPDLDLKGPIGKLMATLLGAVAEFELGCRSERQQRGFQAMRRQQHARSQNAPYGWLLGAETEHKSHSGRPYRQLIPDPREQAILREILQRYQDRETLQSIASDLNHRGIPTKRAGETMTYKEKVIIRKGKEITRPARTVKISGVWQPAIVKSVIEHAELADPDTTGTTPQPILI